MCECFSYPVRHRHKVGMAISVLFTERRKSLWAIKKLLSVCRPSEHRVFTWHAPQCRRQLPNTSTNTVFWAHQIVCLPTREKESDKKIFCLSSFYHPILDYNNSFLLIFEFTEFATIIQRTHRWIFRRESHILCRSFVFFQEEGIV